jgi:hypothetical protein
MIVFAGLLLFDEQERQARDEIGRIIFSRNKKLLDR